MPRKKQYVISEKADFSHNAEPAALVDAQATSISRNPDDAIIVFKKVLGESARVPGSQSVSLQGWLNRGIDAWVWAAIDALIQLLRTGTRSPTTIRSYAEGMQQFFRFLSAGRDEPLVTVPSELSPLHVARFSGWLKAAVEQGKFAKGSARKHYQCAKAVLKRLMDTGIIKGDPQLFFPRAVMPNSHKDDTGQLAFSDAEIQRLARALKADLTDTHHGRLTLTSAQLATLRFVVVALRTGGNLTPLLELKRDAMSPGLLPGTMRLRTVKRRGFQVEERAVRRGQNAEIPTIIPTDAVAVLELHIRDTNSLVADAVPHLQDCVWLYHNNQSGVRCLSEGTVGKSIASLVRRRQVCADDGSLLVVNVSRLRKSFAKRAFRLSNGDVVATARMLLNEPRVADRSYLKADEQLKTEGAEFVGKELVVQLRGDGSPRRVVPIGLVGSGEAAEQTPVARCRDTLHGEHAPKDGGNHCDVFVMCLFCSSFAVVGDPDDLWRLFSYQVFAKSELQRLDAQYGLHETGDERIDRLRKLYRVGIPFIDDFTIKAFGTKLVNAARDRANQRLHPFWELQMSRSQQNTQGVPL